MIVDEDSSRDRFESLYRDHYPQILRYALRRLEPERAKEAAAEVFLVVWRRLEEVPHGSERAWMFAVAHRTVANEWRSESRHKRLVDRIEASTPLAAEVGGDLAQDAVDRAEIQAMLERLPDRDREALQLCEWDGLTAQEAAIVLGCSASAFRVRLYRARRRLLTEYQLSSTLRPNVCLPNRRE